MWVICPIILELYGEVFERSVTTYERIFGRALESF